MSRLLMRFMGLMLCLIMAGCSILHGRMPVKVDSLANQNAMVYRHYVVLPADPALQRNDLVFQEFTRQLDRAMMQAGFIKTYAETEADLIVKMRYSIGAPEVSNIHYQEPVYGEVGTRAVTRIREIKTKDGKERIKETVYEPIYDVVGYEEKVRQEINFTSQLDLEARHKGNDELVWQTHTTSTNGNNDLRYVFPYLVAGTQPYLGLSSGIVRTITIEVDGPEVKLIQGRE